MLSTMLIAEAERGTSSVPIDSVSTRATIIAYEAGHYTIATWKGVGIVHWMAQANGAAVRRVHELFESLVDAHPRGVSFIHVVREGAGLPDPEARRALAEMMASFAGETVCVAVVLLGSGFWASALQSLLTGMRLVAPPRPWTMKFSSRISDVSKWLPELHERRTQEALESGELHAAIELVLSCQSEATALRA